MKILFIDQIAKVNYKYTFSLASSIEDIGHDVVLAIDKKKENCKFEVLRIFNTSEKNIGRIKKTINYISSYMIISKELKNGGYDILHVQWMILPPIDYFFLRRMKKYCRQVITIHDILPVDKKPFDYFFHKKIYANADALIVQADANVERFNELFPELAGKEVMIPHGNFVEYTDSLKEINGRKFFNISEDRFVYLFFGQIKQSKGIDLLIEAFNKLHSEFNDTILIIAGLPQDVNWNIYSRKIKNLGLCDAVIEYIQYIPDEKVKYFFSATDVCVLPYRDIYQSGVLQLSYGYSKPVVATALKSFSEIITDKEDGFLCVPNSLNSLSDAMKVAYLNKEKLKIMGESGKKKMKDRYSWADIAKKINDLYKNDTFYK